LRLADVEQLLDDRAGCGVGDGVEVHIGELQMEVVYQTSAGSSRSAPAIMERIL